MKSFTATHLNKHAQEVFAAAKDGGTVEIMHDRYPGGSFVIVWAPDMSDEEMLKQIKEFGQ